MFCCVIFDTAGVLVDDADAEQKDDCRTVGAKNLTKNLLNIPFSYSDITGMIDSLAHL